MYLYTSFLIFNIVIIIVFSKMIDVKTGIEEPLPFSVGLRFLTEINNLIDEDCAVEVYPDECCLHSNNNRCDIVQIMGVASDIIASGATKTFTMVAPLLDGYQRKGYCSLFIDSRPVSNSKISIRDTVRIKFDTNIKKDFIPKNVRICKFVDEDPLNDCNPVDCNTYYNDRRSHFSEKKHRCVEVPKCLSVKRNVPKTIYNPIFNTCVDKSVINKDDIDYIKEISTKPTRRLTKEVLVLNVRPDSDSTTASSSYTYEAIETEHNVTALFGDQSTTRDIVDINDIVKQSERTFTQATEKPKTFQTVAIEVIPMNSKTFKERISNFFRCLKCNKYTVTVLFIVAVLQCCLICTMTFRIGKKCLCGKKKYIINTFFNDRHDASLTTPLIGTSNIDTETTERQYLSESSNYIEKKIKCYKACQKDRQNNIKLSMSDDIISKYITQRDWLKIHRSETIAAIKTDEDCKMNKKLRSDYKKLSGMKVNFRDDNQGKKSNVRNIIVKKEDHKTKTKEKQFNESSERQICCHSYNSNTNNTIENHSLCRTSGIHSQDKRSDSIEKSAQASFSNDSIDEFLSERGIMCMDDIASKCSYTSISSDGKSTATNQSSKTSKNNIVRNIMTLIPQKTKGPSSDPGTKKTSNDLDLELLYVSRLSLSSSFETDGGKDIKILKGLTD